MSKIQQIRDALANGPLAFRKLHEQIGGEDKKLRDLLYAYKAEFKVGGDDDRTITATGRRAPPRSKGKKPAGKKGKRVKRPYKKIAERVARASRLTPDSSRDLGSLALTNYRAAGALLRQAVVDGVDGLDENLALRNAIDNHDRAEQILNAARGA